MFGKVVYTLMAGFLFSELCINGYMIASALIYTQDCYVQYFKIGILILFGFEVVN